MATFTRKMLLVVMTAALAATGIGSLGGVSGCGSATADGRINPHFEDVSESATTPTIAIDPNDAEQVTVIAADIENQGAKIGTIADQDPTHVLCVVIDPADGDLADLEVCDAGRVNTETRSAEGLCPEADQPSRCASRNGGSGPDFCEVTGTNDYAFVILNPSGDPVTVAYQVVNVTGYPGKSCADLAVVEDSIRSDD